MPSLFGLLTPRGSSTPRDSPRGRNTLSAAASESRFLGDGTFSCSLGSLTPEEVALARVNFHKFDVDGDGMISRTDFGAAMSRHDPSWRDESRRAQLDAMYAAVDLDGTGQVTFEKFAVMRVRKKMNATERAQTQACPPQPPGAGSPPPLAMAPGGGYGSQQQVALASAAAAAAYSSLSPRGAPPSSGFQLDLPHGGGGGATPRGYFADPAASPRNLATAPPPVAPLQGFPMGSGGGSSLTARGEAAAGSGAGFASPRTTNFLMALSQAYYTTHPHGNGWLPSRHLYDLLCQVAQQYALPLSAAQAAELCRLADAGDGYCNLHQVLSMDSVSRYFEQFTHGQGLNPQAQAQAAAAMRPAPSPTASTASALSREASCESSAGSAGGGYLQHAPPQLSPRHPQQPSLGTPRFENMRAEATAAAYAAAAQQHEHEQLQYQLQHQPPTQRDADEERARAALAAELEARVTASLASLLEDKFRGLAESSGGTPRVDEGAATTREVAAVAEAEAAASAAEAAAKAAATVAERLETHYEGQQQQLQAQHAAEMERVSDELARLRAQLREGKQEAEHEKRAADEEIAALEARHADELGGLREQMLSTQQELSVRRAAETRAKLELRARRDMVSKARTDAEVARSELAGLAAERAERAKHFQQNVGLVPTESEDLDALSSDAPRRPEAAASTAREAAVPKAASPSSEEEPRWLTEAASVVSGPPAAAASARFGAAVAGGAEAARTRYDSLTPRTGAKAAQIASISSLMGAIEKDESDWTPVPTPRLVKEASGGGGGGGGDGRLDDGPPPRPGLSAATEAGIKAAAASAVGAANSDAASAAKRDAKMRVRALQAEANEAASESVSAGAEARRALQTGDLAEAGRLAARAESRAAEARSKRRTAESLHASLGLTGEVGAETPRDGGGRHAEGADASREPHVPPLPLYAATQECGGGSAVVLATFPASTTTPAALGASAVLSDKGTLDGATKGSARSILGRLGRRKEPKAGRTSRASSDEEDSVDPEDLQRL